MFRSASAFSVIVLLAMCCSILASPQSDEAPNGIATAPVPVARNAHPTVIADPGMMGMPLVAPLFIQDATTESEITMVSNSSQPFDVEITLTALSGTMLSRRTIPMVPHSQSVVDIAALLSQGSQTASDAISSVMLVPSKPASLAAQLSITSRGPFQTSDVEEEFAMMMDSKPANYRGVVSGNSGNPTVAVRSVSAVPQTVSVTCLRESEASSAIRQFQILPGQTLLLRACNASDRAEIKDSIDILGSEINESGARGVSVSSSAPGNELAVFGVGSHRNQSFRSLVAIPFENVNQIYSATAVYPGATLNATNKSQGSFNLQIAFANFSSTPRTATTWLTRGSGTGSKREVIAQALIQPGTTAEWQSDGLSSEPFGGDSVVIETDGLPGELLSSVRLNDTTGATEVSGILPWKDKGQLENGGEHPWSVAGTASDVLLFNADPESKNRSVRFKIYAADGQIWTRRLTIEPLATVRVSLNDVIDRQDRDDKGRSLPKGMTSGIVAWSSGLNPRIFGKLLETDQTTLISRAYACGQFVSVCAASDGPPTTNPIAVGEQTEVDANVLGCVGDTPCSCNHVCGDGSTDATIYWKSNNPSVLSLSSSNGGISFYVGNSPGQAYADVNAQDSNGCSASGYTPINVNQNQCFAQLKYRPVNLNDHIPTGFNHSFWWFQDSSLTHWVVDGGPYSVPPFLYLNSWVRQGDTGYYAADNPNDATAWASPVSGSVCSNVYNLYAFGLAWPQNYTPYDPGTENSNTFAHDDANAAGFNAPKPPAAIGW